MCTSRESINLLLLDCDVAREFWIALFRPFGVEWIMLRKVIQLLDSWRGQVGRNNILEVWRIVPLCIIWCIWRERNARSFGDYKISVAKLSSGVFKSLYAWMTVYNSPHFSSFTEFLDFCSSFSPL
jgi:hypothetical protein